MFPEIPLKKLIVCDVSVTDPPLVRPSREDVCSRFGAHYEVMNASLIIGCVRNIIIPLKQSYFLVHQIDSCFIAFFIVFPVPRWLATTMVSPKRILSRTC